MKQEKEEELEEIDVEELLGYRREPRGRRKRENKEDIRFKRVLAIAVILLITSIIVAGIVFAILILKVINTETTPGGQIYVQVYSYAEIEYEIEDGLCTFTFTVNEPGIYDITIQSENGDTVIPLALISFTATESDNVCTYTLNKYNPNIDYRARIEKCME